MYVYPSQHFLPHFHLVKLDGLVVLGLLLRIAVAVGWLMIVVQRAGH